jgi:lipopolysaccharide export system permease protein
LKKLHKLLLKSFAGPLVATFFIALFILILQFLWQKIDDLAGKGLEGDVIAELLTYASAGLVPTALPLAILVSSIMTFGNLGENFELTAVKSSGISLQKFMRPLIVLSIIFTIGIFFYSNHVIPYTNLKAMSLLYDIKKQREELQIREGVFYNAIEGYSIKIKEKDPKTKLLKDVMIYDHSGSKGNVQVTIADSGYIRMNSDETKLLVTLFKGQTYQEMEEKNRRNRKDREYPHQITKFDKQTLLIDLKGFDFTRTDESLFSDHYQMLNLSQLQKNEDSLKNVFSKTAQEFSQEINKNYNIKQAFVERRQHQLKQEQKMKDNPVDSSQVKEDTTKGRELKLHIDSSKHTQVTHDTIKITDSTEVLSDSLTKDTLDAHQRQLVEHKPGEFNIRAVFDTIGAYEKTEVLRRAQNYARKNSKKISSSRQRFEHRQKRIYKHQIEWHKKFTLSFACIIFFFIGAPLGSIIRKGGLGAPLVISVVLFIIYYIISMTGENFAEKGVIPAYIGMWISSFIFLPVGIFLTYKATNDSVILNTDTYIKAIKKIFSLRFKKDKTKEEKQQVDA